MDLKYTIFSFFDVAALIQGVVFGTLHLLLNKRKNKSTFFLGLLLILFSLALLPTILYDLQVYDDYPELYGLPFYNYWIIYPLFYIYTQKVSILTDRKIKYWLLYPGIISYVVQFFLFLKPYEVKVDIFNNVWFTVFLVSGALYSWGVALWNFKLLNKHSLDVQNSFSRVENKELKWARIFLVFSIIGSSISLFSYYQFNNNTYSKIIYSLFNLLVIYWITYHGVVQRNIRIIISKNEKDMFTRTANSNEAENASSKKAHAENLMERINTFMASSETFKHTELTIVDLAMNLNMHPKRISATINTARNQNFNTYVNHFRIKKAKKLLETNELANLSMEGIGNEVGFHSKSAFYSAFKKFTGTTPTKYKARHAA